MWFKCSGGNGTGDGATITVTYSEEFYGVTLTATNGVKTVTKVAPSTGSVDIDVPEGGSWVIRATVGGETYSSKPVVVELEYATVIETIPNGSTVLPTDDIQTWLKCAGIRDKTTYTTLADVLNDVDTFIALCADSNASDYMARSTTWASGVTADATAMLIVGKCGYCANALRNDNTWNTAINNSPYASYVPVSPVVPTGTVIHSAVEDPTYYMEGGESIPFCTIASGDTETVLASTIESLKNQTITLYSSVAKDPTNLSNDYSKQIRITPNITEIYLMPLSALYWWGYDDGELEDCTAANGWSRSGSYTFIAPTHNANNIYCASSANVYKGIGTKNTISNKTIKCIAQGSTSQSGTTLSGYLVVGNAKDTFYSDDTSKTEFVKGATALYTRDLSNVTNKYISAGTINADRSVYLYALWCE